METGNKGTRRKADPSAAPKDDEPLFVGSPSKRSLVSLGPLFPLCLPSPASGSQSEMNGWKKGSKRSQSALPALAKAGAKLVRLISKTASHNMTANPYFSLAVLFLAALGFGLAPLGLARLWGMVFSPAKPNAVKNAIYECGLVSKGDAWVQFRSAYYLYAIIFLIFDVEAVFLLPFAVAFTGLGVAACLSMLVFVLLLIEGLAWAWAKGVLSWQ